MSAIERYRGNRELAINSQQVAVANALMSRVNRLRLVTGSVQPTSRAMHPRGRHSVRLNRWSEHYSQSRSQLFAVKRGVRFDVLLQR